jgi:hypothetical protein
MSQQLKDYIEHSKTRGVSVEQIKVALLEAGWPEKVVAQELDGQESAPAAPTSIATTIDHVSTHAQAQPVATETPTNTFATAGVTKVEIVPSIMPVAVERVSSPRGVEYALLFLGFWATIAGVITMGNLAIFSQFSTASAAFPLSILIILFPIFIGFFLRLRKAEIKKPALAKDPSRRRGIQVTQLVMATVIIIQSFSFVYRLIGCGGNTGVCTDRFSWRSLFSLLFSYLICGSVFAYLWMIERRALAESEM